MKVSIGEREIPAVSPVDGVRRFSERKKCPWLPNIQHNSAYLTNFTNIWPIFTNKRLQFNKTSK
jgi:hypothetical protein